MSTPPSVASDAADAARAAFAADVARSLALMPRQLPTHYLYDALGSALFDAICHLPWYRVAKTEQRLLAAHASEIFARLKPVSAVVELGPGSGEKLATLMAVCDDRDVTVHLVDVSPAALDSAATRLLAASPSLAIVAHEATYEGGLSAISGTRAATGQTLVVFLGSNIGNFDPAGADALLAAIRATLAAGDALLLGTDLVKPEADLLLAYDDPLGVTAAFDKNLLARVNRELGGDFDLRQFAHRAVWNAAASRIEMHLVSLRQQRVRVPAAHIDMTLAAGEPIWTESSYKYRLGDLEPVLGRAGFRVRGQWSEDGFALTLAEAA